MTGLGVRGGGLVSNLPRRWRSTTNSPTDLCWLTPPSSKVERVEDECQVFLSAIPKLVIFIRHAVIRRQDGRLKAGDGR